MILKGHNGTERYNHPSKFGFWEIRLMDAIIFDFDGVVVDSEPVHYEAFAEILRSQQIELRREDYYAKYLGFDDRDCFGAVLADHGRTPQPGQIADMIARKTQIVQRIFRDSIQALPGAVELICSAAKHDLPVAICSGALRLEIQLASRRVGVLQHIAAIVAADDVDHGKPDPEGYRKAIDRLGATKGQMFSASRCLAVEDSPAGVQAAKAAGMKVLAVTNSYPEQDLADADRVVTSLAKVSIPALRNLF